MVHVAISREEVEPRSGALGARTVRYCVAFTVTFTEQELVLIRAERLADVTVYEDPPQKIPRFREPIHQRLLIRHLVRRRPNTRTFSGTVNANLFERELREKVLPLVREIIGGTRRHTARSISRYTQAAAPRPIRTTTHELLESTRLPR